MQLLIMLALWPLDVALEVEVARALAAADPPAAVATIDHVERVKDRIRQAIALDRPLMLWVGQHDPQVRQKILTATRQALHVDAPAWGEVTSGLIVMTPKGDGYLYWNAAIQTGRISPSSVQAELEMFKPAAASPVGRTTAPSPVRFGSSRGGSSC